MPGSPTTPGRPGARADAPVRVAFRHENGVGTRDCSSFAAQWLAYALPYRRFAAALAGDGARLGADVDRYSFIVRDLHPLTHVRRWRHNGKHLLALSFTGFDPERSSSRTGVVHQSPKTNGDAISAGLRRCTPTRTEMQSSLFCERGA